LLIAVCFIGQSIRLNDILQGPNLLVLIADPSCETQFPIESSVAISTNGYGLVRSSLEFARPRPLRLVLSRDGVSLVEPIPDEGAEHSPTNDSCFDVAAVYGHRSAAKDGAGGSPND
jgi:hypothetical protein